MYSTLKRLCVAFTLFGEIFLLHKMHSLSVVFMCFLIIFGALLAGVGHLSDTIWGYSLAILSAIFQCLYLIWIKKSEIEGLNSFEVLYYSNLLSVPFLFAINLVSGEVVEFINKAELITNGLFMFIFIMNLLVGALLNYSMFLCTSLNSPLTTTVVGQFKSLITLVVGVILLANTNLPSEINLLGMFINAIGGFGYVYCAYKRKLNN